MTYPPEGWEVAADGGLHPIDNVVDIRHADSLLIRAADVKMENTTFLMDPYVPMNGVTVVAGIGGLGKSHFTLDVAARATRGQLEGDLHGEPVSVVVATAEDAHASTMVPRLHAAGADLDRVFLVRQDAAFALDDLDAMDAAMTANGARLLVLDPIVAYMPTRLDAHKDQHARAILGPLRGLADTHDAAVLAVMHLNKATDAQSFFLRVSSSVGFVNAARSGLLFAPDPEDDKNRVLAHGKVNLSEPGESRRFRIEGCEVEGEDEMIRTSRIVWMGTSDHTIDDLLRSDHRRDPRNGASRFLLTALADGPVLVRWLQESAKDEGLGWRTVERAKAELGIVVDKTGFDGGWEWCLPTPEGDHGKKWRPSGVEGDEAAGQSEDRHFSPSSGRSSGGGEA